RRPDETVRTHRTLSRSQVCVSIGPAHSQESRRVFGCEPSRSYRFRLRNSAEAIALREESALRDDVARPRRTAHPRDEARGKEGACVEFFDEEQAVAPALPPAAF